MTESLATKYDALVAMAHDLGTATNTMRCDMWQLDYLLGALARGPECAVIVGDPSPTTGAVDIDICWYRKDNK